MKVADLRLAALFALQSVLLSGCVAAVVPVVAGGLIAKTKIADKSDAGKSDRSPKSGHRKASLTKSGPTTSSAPPTPVAEPLPQRRRPTVDREVPPGLRVHRAGTSVQLSGLTALPARDGATGAAADVAFAAFTQFALTTVHAKSDQPFRSALIDPATLTSRPARADCRSEKPAVLIDLDPGKAAFDLDHVPAAAPGLAKQLASLRAAGLTILWQANLPVEASERLQGILAAVGLDPDRTDRLLLVRKADERKQARRQEAAQEWCILAMAGDSKDDFEEAFGYLRDPDGIVAGALSANLGDGWFLTPQPVH